MKKKIKIPPPPVRDVDLSALERTGEDGAPQMYVKYIGDRPVAYRYGPEWAAMALMVDGGYPTPEEAMAAWINGGN